MPKNRAAYDKLTQPRQKRFVDEYVVDFNAGQAYKRAGYSANGADQNAWKLMRTHKVRAAIAEALDAVGVTPNRIRGGIAAIAFGDSPSKRVTGLNAHSEQDRLAALRELSKIEGMITEKHEVSGGPVPILFDDGTPAERVAAAAAVSAARDKASEGK